MARPGLTEFRVHKAASELKAAALEPSVRKIRERIGGGNELVLRYLRTWREQQPQMGADEPDSDPLQVAVSAVYDRLVDQVHERLQTELDTNDARLACAGQARGGRGLRRTH